MANNVKIELTPYDAMAILAFLREYINDETRCDYRFKAIQDSVDEYEKALTTNISNEQIEDAIAENSVNKLIGKWPTP